MATGIVEVFAKAGYEVVSVTRGAEKSATVCEAVKTSLNKGVVRGKLSEADRDAALGRVTWSATLDHLADVDLVVEAVVEELQRQEGALRHPRRDLQAGRRARHHHLAPAGDRRARWPPSARPTWSGCTSSTRRR